MTRLKLCLTLNASIFFLASCGGPAAISNQPAKNIVVGNSAPSDTPAAILETLNGKELYAINCMICHKDTGKGGKFTLEGKAINPEDLTNASMKKHSDEKLFSHISDGVEDEGMPAFKDKLNDDEIKEIIQFIRTLQAG